MVELGAIPSLVAMSVASVDDDGSDSESFNHFADAADRAQQLRVQLTPEWIATGTSTSRSRRDDDERDMVDDDLLENSGSSSDSEHEGSRNHDERPRTQTAVATAATTCRYVIIMMASECYVSLRNTRQAHCGSITTIALPRRDHSLTQCQEE